METKVERLQLRVDEASKRRLEDAAAAVHLSMSAFVLQAANARADEVLAERTAIALSEDAAVAFARALAEPSTLDQRLDAVFDRPVQVQWLD